MMHGPINIRFANADVLLKNVFLLLSIDPTFLRTIIEPGWIKNEISSKSQLTDKIVWNIWHLVGFVRQGISSQPDRRKKKPRANNQNKQFMRIRVHTYQYSDGSQDSVGGIATRYGRDGLGIESRWGRDFPHLSRPDLRPTQPPTQGVRGLSSG